MVLGDSGRAGPSRGPREVEEAMKAGLRTRDAEGSDGVALPNQSRSRHTSRHTRGPGLTGSRDTWRLRPTAEARRPAEPERSTGRTRAGAGHGPAGAAGQGAAGPAAPAGRFLLDEQVLGGDGPDALQAVPAGPAGISDRGSGHRGTATPCGGTRAGSGGAWYRQDRTGRTGPGAYMRTSAAGSPPHRLCETPRTSGYRQATADGGRPVEEGGGVVAGMDDAGAGCARDTGEQT
ncbi:hypothetical protein B6E66_14315 [Streptomyces maremycinicus]|nr:hypothetical protein B6E66_14315 [Streptomyces sp. B9173]